MSVLGPRPVQNVIPQERIDLPAGPVARQLPRPAQISSINSPSEASCFLVSCFASIGKCFQSMIDLLFSTICCCFRRENPPQAPLHAAPPSQAQAAPLPAPLPRYNREDYIRVWQETHAILRNGQYLAPNGQMVRIQEDMMNAVRNTQVYAAPGEGYIYPPNPANRFSLVLSNNDCILEGIALKNQGFNPIVLNMASAIHPGGGYQGGDAAQEEHCCRSSALAAVIDSRLGFQERNFYPFAELGGIYNPDVPVFRSTQQGVRYALMDRPVNLSFASVAAIRHPQLVQAGDALDLSLRDIEITKQKIRTQFHMALDHGHDAVVLSAFGAGAYGNPPTRIAHCYMDVLREYAGRIRHVSFAIIDDHNAGHAHNPRGNFRPFEEVMQQRAGEFNAEFRINR